MGKFSDGIVSSGETLSQKHIAVFSLGGTISMKSNAGSGAQPSLSAEDILSTLPAIAEDIEITAATLATVASGSLSREHMLKIFTRLRAEAEAGVDGIVVIQGTDTMEETSYFVDLFWDSAVPVVFTGAMRNSSMPSADGPMNLFNAITIAASQSARNRGVLVTINDEIHEARHVLKSHTSSLAAFSSPNFGPAGVVIEGEVNFYSPVSKRQPLATSPADSVPKVALVGTFLGDDGQMLEALWQAGFEGVIIEGFGAGHVPEACMSTIISAFAGGKMVAVGSRTGSGRTLTKTYGFPGSESDLLERGVLLTGWLHPRKARILLAELLAVTGESDVESLRQSFSIYTGLSV